MNLLIVDDEPLIHISIEYSLNAIAEPDLTVKHAYTGSEMLRMMESNVFDIALVDIRMPGMDGLAAIEEAAKHCPNTRYYIMSGFSEFEYARQAVHLGVTDYLLKPLDEKQLRKIISDTRGVLAKNQENIKEKMRAWLAGTLHRHDVSYLYDTAYTSAVVLLCEDSANSGAALGFVPAENACSLPCREGTLMILFSKSAEQVRGALRQFPRSGYPRNITCFVSPIGASPVELAASLHRMTDLCPIRVYLGTGKRYDLGRISPADESLSEICAEWINLCAYIREKDSANFITLSEKLLSAASELTAPRLQCLCDFISIAAGAAVSNPADLNALRSTLHETEGSLLNQASGSNRLDMVTAYVNEHYAENISINELASRFDLTPNYLSSMFKKRTGVNFVEYLTKLRLSKAKALLTSGNLSIKEIGESVGYYSQSYFTKTFIKHEGCTPGEYRTKKNGSRN